MLAHRVIVAVVALSLISPELAVAQKKPPVAVPTGPVLSSPQNLGVKRGATTEITLTGTNLDDAMGVWMSTGQATLVEGGSEATKLRARVAIPADAPVGMVFIRVATRIGISNVKPLLVEDWPVVEKKAGNNRKSTPQVVAVPCAIDGGIAAETSDFYRFPVQAGQTLTIDAVARRIGSPLDPIIILHDANGRELPGLFADDTPGLQSDARLVHRFTAATDVILEIRDSTHRGGADFVYRLRIGECPSATTAFPLFVQKGKTTEVGFAGPFVDGLKTVAVAPKAGADVVHLSPTGAGGGTRGWPVPVRVSDDPVAVEQEPNGELTKATRVANPGGVSARFLDKDDVDYFVFTAKKGQKLALHAMAHELNSPSEVFLRVLDRKGTELAKSNPQQPTARVEFNPPADDDYFIACEQTNFQFGPNEVYHLAIRRLTPDFAVTFGSDRADIPAGGTGRLAIVGVTRPQGFTSPIDLNFVGPAGITGKLTLAGNANPQPNTPLFLPLSAAADVPVGPVVGKVTATAKVEADEVVRLGSVFDFTKTAFAGLPNPPYELTTQIGLGITPALPFSISMKWDTTEWTRGTTVKGTITAKRVGSFDAEIAIAAGTLPNNAKPTFKPIASGSTTAEVVVELPTNVPTGPVLVQLRGTAKVAGKDVFLLSEPIAVTVADAKKK